MKRREYERPRVINVHKMRDGMVEFKGVCVLIHPTLLDDAVKHLGNAQLRAFIRDPSVYLSRYP